MRFSYSLLAVALGMLVAFPATAQNLDSSASISDLPEYSDGSPAITVDGPIDASRGGAIMLTQNVNSVDVLNGGIRCANNGAGYTTENSFYRLFDLSIYPELTDDFEVSSVDVGMDVVDFPGATPTQEGFVRLYTVANAPVGGVISAGDLTQVAETPYDIDGPGKSRFLQSVNISGTFANTDLLLVEMFLPSGDPAVTGLPDPFNMSQGENDDGETAPVYLASASCGITDPTEIGNLVPGSISGWVMVVTGDLATTANEGGPNVPQTFTLGQSYPNPFNPSATIPFEVNETSNVRISVYDALGREVAVVVDQTFTSGAHSVSFDALGLQSGNYVYRLEANGEVQMRSMTLLK